LSFSFHLIGSVYILIAHVMFSTVFANEKRRVVESNYVHTKKKSKTQKREREAPLSSSNAPSLPKLCQRSLLNLLA
jgi:hypothetical protein